MKNSKIDVINRNTPTVSWSISSLRNQLSERESVTMQNIMFSGDNPQKILSGEKDLTARCWKRKPPRTGQLMTASTGYAAKTRFAILRVTGVWKWDGEMSGKSAREIMWLSLEEIAKREGFGNTPRPEGSHLTDWDAFIEAYYSFNAKNFLDDERKNYFIEFQVIHRFQDGTSVECIRCENPFDHSELNWTFSSSPLCDNCLAEDYSLRNRSPRAGYH